MSDTFPARPYLLTKEATFGTPVLPGRPDLTAWSSQPLHHWVRLADCPTCGDSWRVQAEREESRAHALRDVLKRFPLYPACSEEHYHAAWLACLTERFRAEMDVWWGAQDGEIVGMWTGAALTRRRGPFEMAFW